MICSTEPNPTLYQAVLDRPDEDEPRLAYADWLECHADGQPMRRDQAEFIRLQCQVARLPRHHPHLWSFHSRILALLRQHRPCWLGSRPDRSVRWEFHRGFPEEVVFDSYKSFHENPGVFNHPIRLVRFSALRSVLRLAASPRLEQVKQLSLRGCNLRDAGLLQLLASPYLRNLTHLDLSGNGLGVPGGQALASASCFGQLRHLELGGSSTDNIVGTRGVTALAESPLLQHLVYLGLDRYRIGDSGFWKLVSSPHLSHLVELQLQQCELSAQGLTLLAERPVWPELARLQLANNRLGDTGALLLAQHNWPHLRALQLAGCRLGDAGAEALAQSDHLHSLNYFFLENNMIGNQGAMALARSTGLENLDLLSLDRNLIGDAGGLALGRTTTFPALRRITLSGNGMRPELARAVEQRHAEQDPGRVEVVASPPPPAEPLVQSLPRTPLHGPIDQEGLLDAIADDPDDPVARMILADWYEESGDPLRAEIMRLQCAPSRRRPSSRELQLLTEFRSRDHGESARQFDQLDFEQGLLVAKLSMRTFHTRAFQQRGADWLRSLRVHTLCLTGTTKHWARVADSPALGTVRELRLVGNHMGDENVEILFRSPHLGGLQALGLLDNRLTERSVGHLVRAGHLTRLRSLDLGGNYIRIEGVRLLSSWVQVRQLRELSLTQNYLQASAIALLVNEPGFAGLRRLTLNSNYSLGNSGAVAIARSPHLAGLRRLALAFTSLSSEGVVEIASSPTLTHLCELDLASNSIGDEGARALVHSSVLSHLHLLRVARYRMSPEVWALLQEHFGGRLEPW